VVRVGAAKFVRGSGQKFMPLKSFTRVTGMY